MTKLQEAARALLARIDDRLPMGEASKLVNQTNRLRAALEAEEARQAHGFEAGAEWMREQAARACEAQAEEFVEAIHSLHEAEERTGEDYPEIIEDQVFAQNVLLDQAGRLRSLPASPPAPEEDP